jgi:GNAT superfamily N-acetyltransferase
VSREGSFRVRRFNGDLEGVRRLWAGKYGFEHICRRETLFGWMTGGNPFARGESPYFLLMEGERVIGMVGHMPVRFFVRGEPVPGFLSFDTLLDGDYRGRGLGRLLMEGVRREAPALAGALWFNEANHRLYGKCGWLDVEGFHPYVLVLDPYVFLKDRIGNRALLRAASGMARLALRLRAAGRLGSGASSAHQVQIEQVDEFPAEMSSFFGKVSGSFGVIVERSDAYLNWKFVSRPFNRYRRFVAYRDGRLSGYAVVKVERKGTVSRLRIVDILADPAQPEVFRALVLKGIGCGRERDTSYAEIACTCPRFIRELKGLGFLKAREPQRFMVMNWEGRFERGFITDIGNWYLTFSDGDGDAWEVDSAEGLHD